MLLYHLVLILVFLCLYFLGHDVALGECHLICKLFTCILSVPSPVSRPVLTVFKRTFTKFCSPNGWFKSSRKLCLCHRTLKYFPSYVSWCLAGLENKILFNWSFSFIMWIRMRILAVSCEWIANTSFWQMSVVTPYPLPAQTSLAISHSKCDLILMFL